MSITKPLIVIATSLVLLLPMQITYSAEQVYGWNLMTQQERVQHQQTMRNLKTAEEREQYRIQHHKQMQERAKERGVTLPDMINDRDRTMDKDQIRDRTGAGSGSGMGSGGMGGKGR